jgi:hypothetical protein
MCSLPELDRVLTNDLLHEIKPSSLRRDRSVCYLPFAK